MTRITIDVIIPVFNQIDLVSQCIRSIVTSDCDTNYEILVVDDASNDENLKRLLANLAKEGVINLITNASNIGFTKSVNIGMTAHAERDVLLLNSDTIVYEGWLDCIVAGAYSSDRIATVNPLTTQRGSHISCYPGLVKPYDEGLEVGDEELHRIANAMNAGKYVDVHTTAGFCMYIRRACLRDIGYFDSVHFPVAYGEESDFCYRARKAGWRHLVVGDAFVTHLEGKSFNERKAKMMEDMFKTFIALHPEVTALDRDFRVRDPVRRLRAGVDLGRIRRLLKDEISINVYMYIDPANRTTCELVSLEYIQREHKLHLRVGIYPNSFPNLDAFDLPNDLAKFNHTMSRLGVSILCCSSEECCTAILQATQGIPEEVALQARLVLAPSPTASRQAFCSAAPLATR